MLGASATFFLSIIGFHTMQECLSANATSPDSRLVIGGEHVSVLAEQHEDAAIEGDAGAQDNHTVERRPEASRKDSTVHAVKR
jgi:hypothetical protein